MQKSIQHERKVSSRSDHFIDLPPILEKKKEKENRISIELKNIIYIQHNDINIHHH